MLEVSGGTGAFVAMEFTLFSYIRLVMYVKKILVFIFFFTAAVGYSQTSVIDSLQRFVDTHPGDTNEIKALDHLANEFMRKDLTRAKSYSYQTIALARSLGTHFGLSSAYSGLVAIHQTTGRLDSAQYYLDRLGELVRQIPGNKKIKINYCNTAGLFYKNQGKFREALPYLEETLALIGPGGDKTSRAGQHLNIGNAYKELGDLKTAADYHLKALALFEEVGNKRGQSFCLNSLGNDFFHLGQYAIAEDYLLRSENLKEELGDRRGILTSWMSLGSVYQQTNRFEDAMRYFNKTLARAKELNLSIEEARVLFNMGSLLKMTKRPEEATKAFLQAMALAKQAGDSGLVSRIRMYIVAIGNDTRKEKDEESALLQNIEVSREKGALSNTSEGYFGLADWYASRNQFDKAYANFIRGQQLKDSLSGEQVVVQLKRLEAEYESEKKAKEIALLKKDQELQALALSRQKVIITSIVIAFISILIIGLLLITRYRAMTRARRLIEIESVRNNIARDLHDDVGSALSSINILSQVALREKNGNSRHYFQRIGDQSARIMEDMGDMVWSINPRNDSMSQVIIRMREFATEILDSRNIEYHFSEKVTEGLTLNADKRKNLFMIFKESVNNAAKYSSASQIEISLHQHGNSLLMCVKDNGQGFDERAIKTGNGLRNLRERAREMNANVTLTSIPGEGTAIELLLPLA